MLKSVKEILKCNHSSESYRKVLSCDAVCYGLTGGSNVFVCELNPKDFKCDISQIPKVHGNSEPRNHCSKQY